MVGAFEYLFNIIVAERAGVPEVVPEDLQLIAIVTVESCHGADPEKSFFIFYEAIDLVVGQALVDVQPGKAVKVVLGLGLCGGQAGREGENSHNAENAGAVPQQRGGYSRWITHMASGNICIF